MPSSARITVSGTAYQGVYPELVIDGLRYLFGTRSATSITATRTAAQVAADLAVELEAVCPYLTCVVSGSVIDVSSPYDSLTLAAFGAQAGVTGLNYQNFLPLTITGNVPPTAGDTITLTINGTVCVTTFDGTEATLDNVFAAITNAVESATSYASIPTAADFAASGPYPATKFLMLGSYYSDGTADQHTDTVTVTYTGGTIPHIPAGQMLNAYLSVVQPSPAPPAAGTGVAVTLSGPPSSGSSGGSSGTSSSNAPPPPGSTEIHYGNQS